MKFQLTTDSILTAHIDGVALPITKSKSLPSYLSEIDSALDGAVAKRLKEVDFKADVGQTLVINTMGRIGPKVVILVGMGDEDDFDSFVPRKAYASLVRCAQSEGVQKLGVLYLENDAVSNFFESSIEGLVLGSYSFDQYKTDKKKQKKVQSVLIFHRDKKVATNLRKQVATAENFATSTNIARDLVNIPGSDLYPEKLAAYCKKIFKSECFKLTIMDEKEIKRRKMGAFLSVTNGSPRKPRFIHIEYKPKKKSSKRIAFVGKGVTFDTGGLSLKPPRFMMDMKCDMGGAAAVVGAMKGLEQLKPNVAVDGIIAATENIPGNGSTLPGDVVYAANGKSIEVLNTDAEGRLTLADALDYATKLPGVDRVINLATLTGACVVAVGDLFSAAMTNDDDMVGEVIRAGALAGEPIWQLPLPAQYESYIVSDIADIKNIGKESGGGGTITAGLFLKHFVNDKPWVHLDIAGPAFYSSDQVFCPKGGSGFGVRTLLHYLNSL